MEGMRSFVRARRKRPRRARRPTSSTLDAVGGGDVRYATSEGAAVSFALDRRLAELCEAIAKADGEDGNRFRAEPVRRGVRERRAAGPARGHPGDHDHLP